MGDGVNRTTVGSSEVMHASISTVGVFVCLQMSVSGRLDQHLFHVIEVQNNSVAYLEKRKNVIEVCSCLGHVVRSIGR